MKIAVFPGSFNPMHIGHKAIIEHLGSELGVDRTYVVVTPQNPWKDRTNAQTADDRLLRAREAVQRCESLNAVVDDIELRMDPPHYTIRTLEALREREPGNSFTLVIGADNFTAFRAWRDYQRILLEFGVAVFPRSGADIHAMKDDLLKENPDYKIAILEMEEVDMSSTFIREAMKKGEDVSAFLM